MKEIQILGQFTTWPKLIAAMIILLPVTILIARWVRDSTKLSQWDKFKKIHRINH